MRNLKRTLSLVLAMALVVGMMMVGASAASSDFVDGDEITYTEAAEIMTALGVFEGTDKGAFDPAGTLTREQAAAIICRMLLGDDAENVNTNSVVFSDVAADRWSAGYIAYCAQQGILAGTGNGTFDPEGELTGLAFAKMLLVALGYDPAIEQYVGDDWAVNVAADAVDAGIAISGVVMANAVSREQAAQMAYQTLEANMVSYASKGTTVIGSDGMQVIVGASAAEPVDNYITNDYDSSKDGIQQFCERYFSDLKKTDGEDDFKRPAAQWKLKNEIIGTYAAEAEGTYTAGVEKGDLYDLIGRTVYNAITSASTAEGHADFTVYENGSKTGVSQTVADYIEDDSTTKVGGNGVLTQVYVDDDTNNVIISMINTYVAKVDGDYDEEDDELVLDDLGLALPAETTLSGEDFENLASFSDGDYVLVTAVGDEIKTIQAAETVTGTVTSYTKEKNVTVDGEKYSYTKGYKGPDKNYTLNSDYDLVLDTYGYVIYADGVEASDDYVFVTEVAKISGLENSNYEARAYFTDGTTAVIEVSNPEDVSWTSNGTKSLWYTYDEQNDGTYELDNVADQPSDDFAEGKTILDTGNTSITLGTSVRLNNDTVFLVRRGTSVNVYTGIKNVPTVTVKNVDDEVVTVKVAAVVDDNDYAEYVIVSGTSDTISVTGSTAGDRIYILDAKDFETTQDADDNEYYIYDAIVNGEIGTAELSTKVKSTGLYGSVTYDNDGYVDGLELIKSAADDNLKAWTVYDQISYTAGVLSFEDQSLVLADDCTIFLNDGGTGKTTSASRLARDYEDDAFNGVISAVYDDSEVIEIYVEATDGAAVDFGPTVSAQPESPEAMQESMKDDTDYETWQYAPYLVAMGLDQKVGYDAEGKLCVFLSGTIASEYTISKDTTLSENQKLALNKYWGSDSIESFDDLVAITASNTKADDVITYVVVTENGDNHFAAIRKTEDGAEFMTGRGQDTTQKSWTTDDGVTFYLDISGLSF